MICFFVDLRGSSWSILGLEEPNHENGAIVSKQPVYPSIRESRRLVLLAPRSGKVRMVLDTDTFNETPRLQTVSREAFWQRHVAQWRHSGLSKSAYCQQYALTYHQMVYWAKKDEQDVEPEQPSSGFVTVAVSSDDNEGILSVRLPNGLIIQGINDRSMGLVGKLIAQL